MMTRCSQDHGSMIRKLALELISLVRDRIYQKTIHCIYSISNFAGFRYLLTYLYGQQVFHSCSSQNKLWDTYCVGDHKISNISQGWQLKEIKTGI